MIQRIREKGISEAEIRAFVAAGFTDPGSPEGPPVDREETPPNPRPFRELFRTIETHLEDSAVRFIRLPDADPYWRDAPRDQSFRFALESFLHSEHRDRPNDERVLWSLAGLDVLGFSNAFGREYWLPLAVKDLGNVRFLVDSAVWVWWTTGRDVSADLASSLAELSAKVPGLHEWLMAATRQDADPDLQKVGEIALRVAEGRSVYEVLLELTWERAGRSLEASGSPFGPFVGQRVQVMLDAENSFRSPHLDALGRGLVDVVGGGLGLHAAFLTTVWVVHDRGGTGHSSVILTRRSTRGSEAAGSIKVQIWSAALDLVEGVFDPRRAALLGSGVLVGTERSRGK